MTDHTIWTEEDKELADLSYKLRSGHISREDMLIAAGVIDAYGVVIRRMQIAAGDKKDV